MIGLLEKKVRELENMLVELEDVPHEENGKRAETSEQELERKIYETYMSSLKMLADSLISFKSPEPCVQTIALKNFKAFCEKTQKFSLRPLTLVYAPNSVGKSSFLHALIFLDYVSRFHLKKEDLSLYQTKMFGDLINFGGFENYVHRHDENREIEFTVEIDDGRLAFLEGMGYSFPAAAARLALYSLRDSIHDESYAPALALLEEMVRYEVEHFVDVREDIQKDYVDKCISQVLSVRASTPPMIEKREELVESEISLSLKKCLLLAWMEKRESGKDFTRVLEQVLFDFSDIHPEIGEGISMYLAQPALLEINYTIGRDMHKSSYYLDGDLVGAFSSENLANGDEEDRWMSQRLAAFDRLVHSKTVQYIGPLRFYPNRNFILEEMWEDRPTALDTERLWSLLKGRRTIREELNEWLSHEDKLKSHYEIRVKQGQILFYDKRHETEVSHRDLGLGISQLLPILIASHFGRESTIFIEQPELHLHPALQAEIADEFIKGYKKGRNHYVIETHSEYLLLRIMKRIRHKAQKVRGRERALDIDAKDVALVYIDADEQSTYIKELSLGHDGRLLDPWPGGFFEEGFKERFE